MPFGGKFGHSVELSQTRFAPAFMSKHSSITAACVMNDIPTANHTQEIILDLPFGFQSTPFLLQQRELTLTRKDGKEDCMPYLIRNSTIH